MNAPQTEGEEGSNQREELTAQLFDENNALKKANQELETKLEKLRITSESNLNLEKKYNEKTVLELTQAKHQIRELQKEIQRLTDRLQQKEKEIEELKMQNDAKGTVEQKFSERDVNIFRDFFGRSPGNTNAYDGKVIGMIRVFQDKKEQLEKDNRTLIKEGDELQEMLNKKEEELVGMRKDVGQTYEKLLKEKTNRLALIESENNNLDKDNEALRERLEKLETEIKSLRLENLELTKKCNELRSRNSTVDLGTPNRWEGKFTNNSSPKSTTLKTAKSLTTSKKVAEDKGHDREGGFYGRGQEGRYNVADLDPHECRKIVGEVLDIYNIRNPADIIPSVKKTEKVMQAIPKLHKLLGEIANIVFSKNGISQNESQIEMIIPYLKNWANGLDELEVLRDFRRKLIEKMGLARGCDNIEIIKNVDNLMYMSLQNEEIRLRSQREANENIEQKIIIEQLSKLLGEQPTVPRMKQITTRLNDVRDFIDIAKKKLKLDPLMSDQGCLTHLLKYMDSARKDEQSSYIVAKLHKMLNCGVDDIVPVVEGIINDRRSPLPYGPRKHI